MIYGDSTINTNQSDPANTWDSSFKGVWHLGNGSSLSLSDSTSNGNALANVGATGATSGKISGGAGPFNGTSQCLKTTSSINLGTNKVTLSAWVNITGYANSNFAALAQFANTNWYFNNNSFSSTPNEAGAWGVWAGGNGGGHNGGTFTRPSAGVHHVVFTYDTTQGAALNVQAYVDGVAQAITQRYSDNTASANFGNYVLHMMGQSDESVFWPATYLDEVRLSSTIRSAGWVTAEYNNQSSPSTFMTMGSESCSSATPTPIPTATPTLTPTPTATSTPTPTATVGPIQLSAQKKRIQGINTVRLTWAGATSANIDVYRNGTLIATTPNNGQYDDSTGDTGRAQYTYQVCAAGTQNCSNQVTVSF